MAKVIQEIDDDTRARLAELSGARKVSVEALIPAQALIDATEGDLGVQTCQRASVYER